MFAIFFPKKYVSTQIPIISILYNGHRDGKIVAIFSTRAAPYAMEFLIEAWNELIFLYV